MFLNVFVGTDVGWFLSLLKGLSSSIMCYFDLKGGAEREIEVEERDGSLFICGCYSENEIVSLFVVGAESGLRLATT